VAGSLPRRPHILPFKNGAASGIISLVIIMMVMVVVMIIMVMVMMVVVMAMVMVMVVMMMVMVMVMVVIIFGYDQRLLFRRSSIAAALVLGAENLLGVRNGIQQLGE
jgi:hypothetical protein